VALKSPGHPHEPRSAGALSFRLVFHYQRSNAHSRKRPTAARIVARRSFHLFVIPEDIVFIAPQFRGFRCFVFEDELVIVDPFTFEIIAIIPI